MKEIVTSITQRGQVTVPAEVRRMLGLKLRGKVAFAIADGEVRLVPAQFTLETAYGSVPRLRKAMSDKEMARVAKEERAGRLARGLRPK